MVYLYNFLGVELYDDDFIKLIFKFSIAFSFMFVIVRGLYYPGAKKKEYAFSYLMLGVVIFFISFTLKKFELGTGMALGLFAIFGIIRYRTDAMPVKEMTYLFIVIGISVINALTNKKVSYSEIMFTNFVVLATTYAMEKLWFSPEAMVPVVKPPKPPKPEAKQAIVYDNLVLLKPENNTDLLIDLHQKTGLDINRVKIDLIDYKNNFAQITLFYKNI